MVEASKAYGNKAVEIAIDLETVTNAITTKLNDTEEELKNDVGQWSTKE